MVRVAILDVSCFDRDELFRSEFITMSNQRQDKIGRYYFRKDRNLSLGVGVVLDRLLMEYGLQEREMIYDEGANGKPFFVNRPDLCFNLSHAGSYVIGAIAEKKEIGVDIEQNVLADAALLERCCHPCEIEFLLSLPQPQRDRAFTRIWTIKESFIKAIGVGLSYESLTDIYTHPKEPILNGCGINGEYSFSQSYLSEYSFAICVKGELTAINFLDNNILLSLTKE